MCLTVGCRALHRRLWAMIVGLETTRGAWVLLTRTELILLITEKQRLCRIRLDPEAVTLPLCRQLKLNLVPALQATL